MFLKSVPWGTLHTRFDGLERVLISIINFYSLRKDLNQKPIFFEKPTHFNFFIKVWWSLLSNIFCKPIEIISIKRTFANPVVIFSVRCLRQVLVKSFFSETSLKSVEDFIFTQKFLFTYEQSFQQFLIRRRVVKWGASFEG